MVYVVYAGVFRSSRKSHLQSGKRVTSVAYGDTHVQYAPVNLEDLLRLRSQIKASLAESTSRKH